MEATRLHTPLNATQKFVVRTFTAAKSEPEREELTSFYLDYIQRKMDEASDQWWKENNMTAEKFEEMCSNLHFRVSHLAK